MIIRRFMRLPILAIIYCQSLFAQPPIEEFVETFDGNGAYETTDGRYRGFDNPNWGIAGIGDFKNGGFSVVADPIEVDTGDGAGVRRLLYGRGDFREKVEVRNIYMAPIDLFSPPSSASVIRLEHRLDLRSNLVGDNRLMIWVVESNEDTTDWLLGISVSDSLTFRSVASGEHISMEILYNDTLSESTFFYDDNLDDESPAQSFGPFQYTGSFDDSHWTNWAATAWSWGVVHATIDHWSLTWVPSAGLGDFNGNTILDVDDIDRLSSEVRAGTNNSFFDLNSDSLVDDVDRRIWVEELKETYFGDSNLDGQFSSLDLVTVFQAAQYEDQIDGNSTWSTGDWNGDVEFTSRDLVLAFTTGGYEQGPRALTQSVPDPGACGFGVLMLLAYLIRCASGRSFSRTAKSLSKGTARQKDAVAVG